MEIMGIDSSLGPGWKENTVHTGNGTEDHQEVAYTVHHVAQLQVHVLGLIASSYIAFTPNFISPTCSFVH